MSGTDTNVSLRGNRRYTPLPFEYLEEMELLSDEEYGRLIRALQRYSMQGEVVDCPGREVLYYKRVLHREDRFHKEFESIQKQRSYAGKKGAKARWGAEKKEEVSANQIFFESTVGEGTDGKNGNTKAEAETETETETKTETNDIPAEAGKYHGESGASASATEKMENFCVLVRDKLDLRMSQESRNEFLREYSCLSMELCEYAVNRCSEEGRLNWSYLRGILRNMKTQKVQSVDQDRLRRQERTAKLGSRNLMTPEKSRPSYQSHKEITLTPLERHHMEEILRETE